MNNQKFLSIIIPAYNEAARIGNTLHRIERYFNDRSGAFSYEINDFAVFPTIAAVFGIALAIGVRFLNIGYNTAFNDEAIYIVIGKLGLFQWDWWSYNAKSWMAGLPYIYPPLAAIASQSYGIVGARLLSVFMSILILEEVYRFTRTFYIYEKKHANLAGLIAAFFAGFAAVGLFVSRLATYDALSILLLLFSINLLVSAHTRNDGRDYFLSALAIFFAIATKIIIAAYIPLLLMLSLAHVRQPVIRALWARYFIAPLGILLLCLVLINADGFLMYAKSQIGREYISLSAIVAAFWRNAKYAILLGVPAMAAGMVWGERGKIILLAAAASMIPTIHFITHRLATLDKHSFLFIIFMSVIIGHGISVLLYQKYLQLAGTCVLIAAALFYMRAEARYLDELEHGWINADAMLAVLAEHTRLGNKVLSEQGASTILYLYNKIPPENVTTFDWMEYQGMTGEDAYLQAVRDGYFDFIELDGQFNPNLAAKIQPELEGKYSRVYFETPFEIYARSF